MNKKFNFHGHTYLCGHAGGSPIDYVKEALKQNFSVLGISEHAPMPNLFNKNSRLEMKDYDLYFKLLDEAEDYAKLHGLKFYRAFEIEYFKELDVYEKYLDRVDYLILGQHYIVKNGHLKSTFGLDSLEDIKIYAKTVIEALNTGYFSMLCHPDLCFFNIEHPTDEMYEALRDIIVTAKELDIPIELNANGIRRAKFENTPDKQDVYKYPRVKFFEMVKKLNAKVIVSSDCHSVDALYDFAMDKAYEFAHNMDLQLVDTIPMKGRRQ